MRPGLSTLGLEGGGVQSRTGRDGTSFGTWFEHVGVEGAGASSGARVLSSSSPFALRDLSSKGIASYSDASRKDFQARLATDHIEVGGTREKK